MAFDVNRFVSAAVDPLETKFVVCPEGEFQMMLDTDPKQLEDTTNEKVGVGIKHHAGTSKSSGKPYDFYDWTLMCIVMDEKVKQTLGRDSVKVRMRVGLDLDGSGGLATGPNKNVGLGRLRDALGQNKPDWTPQQLLGAGPFMGKVAQTKDDKGNVYADVVLAGKIT